MNTNDNDAVYYQFPLSLLAFGKTPDSRLRAAVAWQCVEVGKMIYAGMNKTELKEYATGKSREQWPDGLLLNRTDHLALLAGMRKLNVTSGSVRYLLENHATLERFFSAWAFSHGGQPFARVRSDLLWDCIGGKMPYRVFSVAAACYSVIGAKKHPVRITRNRIRAAAMGYKSPAMLTDETLAKRQDGATPLTERQVRYSLDDLETRGLIARVQTSPRVVYFSHRMDADGMRESLLAWKTRRPTKLAANRSADRDLQKRIRETIKAATAIKADNSETEGC